MDNNKKSELVEKLILKQLNFEEKEAFNTLYIKRNLENPSSVFDRIKQEFSATVKEIQEKNKNRKPGEPELKYLSDNPQVQVLIDISNSEFRELIKYVGIHSETVWGVSNKANLLRYCYTVGIISDKSPSETSIKEDETAPISKRPIFIFKTLYPYEYESLKKLLSKDIPNPLLTLENAKLSGELTNMPSALCNEIVDSSIFWSGQPKCNVLLLYCRIMGYAEIPETDINKMKRGMLSKDVLAFLEEKSRNRIFELSSEIDNLQEYLLDTVKGQDQAVRALCEGLFASEIFGARQERMGAKALFLFTGPPGTGKSFLATQAAEYLNRPYKVYNMTEFSGHEDQGSLIGIDYYWRASHCGILTSYVAENPNAILIFDEIEKAHLNTLHIFYDILNSGTLTDKYWDTARSAAITDTIDSKDVHRRDEFLSYNPVVSFKDTIIIFTSNAGRSLYEDSKQNNLSLIEKKTLINALETEINPLTKEPFFPSALVSRVATGFPLLFNHLKPRHLLEIIRSEYKHISELFEQMYGISMLVDDPDTIGDTHNVLVSILLSEGGMADARTVKARASLFFKTKIHRSIQEIKLKQLQNFESVKTIIFKTDLDGQPDDVKNLFSQKGKPRILIYARPGFKYTCERSLPDCDLFYASSLDEIKVFSGMKDIDFAIVNITSPMGSDAFYELRAANPDLPIYLIEYVFAIRINQELISSYLRAGAYGSIVFNTGRGFEDESGFEDFAKQVSDISDELYMLKKVEELSSKHKTLTFNTETFVDGEKAYIKITDFEFRRAADADDLKSLLGDSDIPTERFCDIVGASRAKEELQFFIDFLKKPAKFTVSGLKPPKGVLLYGPPGTGKTMLAKAMAGEAGINFIAKAASNFHQVHVGTGPKAVRDLFARARKYAPCIVFIDEIDYIGKSRGGSGNHDNLNEETLNALLTEMDGFSTDPKKPVFVLAATNYDVENGKGGIGVIDAALSRRFDSRILVDLPNTEERKELIEKELAKISKHAVTDIAVKNLAERSDAFRMNPSNLVATINEAKRTAFRKSVSNADFLLDNDTLLEAFDVVTSGEEKPLGGEYLERTARHEAGHAVIYYLCGNLPAYITVVARSNYGGYMARSSKDINNPFPTKKDLLCSVRTSLGGYAAEFICYGVKDSDEGLSSGASSDLQNASDTIRKMITQYGMYDEFGLAVGVKESDESVGLINKILREQLSITKELITDNRAVFENVVQALMTKKKLTEQEFKEICDGTSSI
jgi:ATP-dependent Zn protease